MGMYYEIHWYAGKLSLPRFISNISVHETMVDVGNDVQSPPVASHMEKKPKPAGNICPFHDSNCQRVFIQFMLLCLTFPSCSHSNSLRIAIFQGYLPMKHEDENVPMVLFPVKSSKSHWSSWFSPYSKCHLNRMTTATLWDVPTSFVPGSWR